ncbi:MAG: hypothetical protein V4467_03135 [Patescibacteria group bacterium]
MFYFLHGKDSEKARAKASELILSMKKKKPDAQVFTLDADNWLESQFDNFLQLQGLFERRFIVFAKRLFEKREIKEAVLSKLTKIKNSENVFVFLEGAVDKPTLKLVEANADRVQEFEKIKAQSVYGAEGEGFNFFSLADALGERNKKKLWVLYQKAVREDASSEELSGILFWQLKNLILAQEVATAGEAGVSPFVFSKSKRFSHNFSLEELQGMSLKIIELYHDAHRGKRDFDSGLETFVLNV